MMVMRKCCSSKLTEICVFAEVDKAVAEAGPEVDGTRGRGANGHISIALEAEQRKNGL
jgi:hypothetical protein